MQIVSDVLLSVAILACSALFASPYAYALWRLHNPRQPKPPRWSFEPHKTNPGDVDMPPRPRSHRESRKEPPWAEWVDVRDTYGESLRRQRDADELTDQSRAVRLLQASGETQA